MEQLDVFDCSNVLIASYFADDRECAHENREHTLIYQCWLQKRIGKGEPYRSIVLKFSKAFLREFY